MLGWANYWQAVESSRSKADRHRIGSGAFASAIVDKWSLGRANAPPLRTNDCAEFNSSHIDCRPRGLQSSRCPQVCPQILHRSCGQLKANSTSVPEGSRNRKA